jgi:succinoglycan biosynthesis protein ExoA
LNEAPTLPGILSALSEGDPEAPMVIVVADGGSTDGTVDIAEDAARRDPRITVLPNPQRLQSAGVNLAVRRYGDLCEWLIRMDAHAEYPRGFVRRLVETAQRVGAESVVVPMITQGRTCFQQAVAAAQNSRLGTGGAAHRRRSSGGWIEHGHHALFSLAAFNAIGGYDETFVANEDAELDARLAKAGGRVWLADELAIVYYPRDSARALFRQYLRHGAGRARTLLRHKIRPKLRQTLPLLVALAIALLAPALVFPLLAAPAALWAMSCLLYGLALGVLARRPCFAAAGIAAMIMHGAWSFGFWFQLLRRGTAGAPLRS